MIQEKISTKGNTWRSCVATAHVLFCALVLLTGNIQEVLGSEINAGVSVEMSMGYKEKTSMQTKSQTSVGNELKVGGQLSLVAAGEVLSVGSNINTETDAIVSGKKVSLVEVRNKEVTTYDYST